MKTLGEAGAQEDKEGAAAWTSRMRQMEEEKKKAEKKVQFCVCAAEKEGEGQ